MYLVGVLQHYDPEVCDGPAEGTTLLTTEEKRDFVDALGSGELPRIYAVLDHAGGEKTMATAKHWTQAEDSHFQERRQDQIGELKEAFVGPTGDLNIVLAMDHTHPTTHRIRDGIDAGERWGFSTGTRFLRFPRHVENKEVIHIGVTRTPLYESMGTTVKEATVSAATLDSDQVLGKYLTWPGVYFAQPTLARLRAAARGRTVTTGASEPASADALATMNPAVPPATTPMEGVTSTNQSSGDDAATLAAQQQQQLMQQQQQHEAERKRAQADFELRLQGLGAKVDDFVKTLDVNQPLDVLDGERFKRGVELRDQLRDLLAGLAYDAVPERARDLDFALNQYETKVKSAVKKQSESMNTGYTGAALTTFQDVINSPFAPLNRSVAQMVLASARQATELTNQAVQEADLRHARKIAELEKALADEKTRSATSVTGAKRPRDDTDARPGSRTAASGATAQTNAPPATTGGAAPPRMISTGASRLVPATDLSPQHAGLLQAYAPEAGSLNANIYKATASADPGLARFMELTTQRKFDFLKHADTTMVSGPAAYTSTTTVNVIRR